MTPTEAYRAALEAALKIIQSNTTPCSAAYLWHWTGKEIMNYDAGQADAAHSFCNAIRALPVPDEPKRSFPDAADGSPSLPMEPELWAAGCDLDTARFVARQLAYDGYTLSKADELDRLRAENEKLTEQNKTLGDMIHKRGNDLAVQNREVKKLRAENERLRAVCRRGIT